MKTKDIARKYGFNIDEFEAFLNRKHYYLSNSLTGLVLPDSYVDSAVKAFKEDMEEKQNQRQAQEAEEIRKEVEKMRREEERKNAIANMLVSSGFNFDGYTVKKYSGYISGDDTIEINRDDLNKNNGKYLTDCLAKIRIQALKELKEAAYDLGCNAIIGVDFDYMTFEPETISGTIHYYQPYMICVTANGNAVVIEKN